MIGRLFGGLIRGLWYVTKALWAHPVLRLVILAALGIWLLPRLWWTSAEAPGSHAYTVAGIVVGLLLVWWLLVGDTVHHLYPRPWLTAILRSGYPVLTYPLVAAWGSSALLDWGIVIVVSLIIGIVPLFTNSISRRNLS